MFKYLKRFTVIVMTFLLICTSTGGAVLANDGTNDLDVSDLDYLKGVYEELIDSENPEKSFTELPYETQEALINALTNGKTEVIVIENEPKVQMATRGGQNITIQLNHYSLFGSLIWTFQQTVIWYYNGTYITQIVSAYALGSAPDPFWHYDGIIGQSQSGGAGYTYFNMFSQGLFTLRIGGWVIESMTPWINFWAYGNGSYSYTYSYG